MINCAKCGKENQDHYKFCLGCGAELAKSAAPKPFNPDTPPHGQPAVRPSAAPRSNSPAAASAAASPAARAAQPAPLPTDPPAGMPVAATSAQSSSAQSSSAAQSSAAQPAASPAAAQPAPVQAPAAATTAPAAQKPALEPGGATLECPQCGHTNKLGNRFCASCGFNLSTSNPPAVVPRPAPAAAAGTGAAPSISVSLTALRADGTEAGTFALPSQPTTLIGRDTGSIFAGDSYLSPRHASINVSGSQVMIRDEGSLNGVYLKLRPQAPWMLKFGDLFRIGQEIIKLEALENQPPGADGVERLGSPRDGYVGRLALVIGRDTTGNAFPIPRGGVHCGRERGDILFSEDGYVSGLHCRIAPESDGSIYLTDVGSSNGTFVRLGRDHVLTSGDILLMGQQLFRIDMR